MKLAVIISFSVILIMSPFVYCYCQDTATKFAYEKAFADIKEALDMNAPFSFKEICFVTEDTYLSGRLDFTKFNNAIQQLKLMAISWMKANPLRNYQYSDSTNFHRNLAI